jgi:hypothetical protein
MNSPSDSATLNYQLTNFATGFMNDVSRGMELADRLCPIVRTPGSTGQYKTFDDVNSFTVYNTARAAGGDPNTIGFSAGDAYYNCEEQALQVKIDIKERRDAGDLNNLVAQQLVDEGKIQALINSQINGMAHKRVQFVLANLAAEAGVGNFSNPDIDPIDQIDEKIEELLNRCNGQEQNLKITLSRRGWRSIRNHPKVKARCNGVKTSGIRLEELAEALTTPVEIKVFSFLYLAKSAADSDPAKLGASAPKKKALLDGDIILHYSTPNATVYDPSAFKAFMPVNVGTVKSYSASHGLWSAHFVDWSEVLKQTSTLAAMRLTIT